MTDRTGHCMCGAVGFTATDMADEFSTCHCKICQRWAGSAFKGVSVKNENLILKGDEHIGTYQSSDFAERSFCKKCGSAIWFKLTAGKYAGNTSLAIGLLDNTEGLTLSTEYFSDYRNSSDDLPEGRKQYTEADVEKMISDFMGEEPK